MTTARFCLNRDTISTIHIIVDKVLNNDATEELLFEKLFKSGGNFQIATVALLSRYKEVKHNELKFDFSNPAFDKHIERKKKILNLGLNVVERAALVLPFEEHTIFLEAIWQFDNESLKEWYDDHYCFNTLDSFKNLVISPPSVCKEKEMNA